MDNKEYLDEELKKAANILDAVQLKHPDKMAYVLVAAHIQETVVDISTLTNSSASIADHLLVNARDILKSEPEEYVTNG